MSKVIYTRLETVEDINSYIDRQHYEVCNWALQVNEKAVYCERDCPFPDCVECDGESHNAYYKQNYVNKYLRGEL